MIIGICREHVPGETRVAMTPANVQTLTEKGQTVLVESDAGTAAGFSNESFVEVGAEIVADRSTLIERAELVLAVQAFSSDEATWKSEISALRSGQIIAGMLDPLGRAEMVAALAEQGVSALALEMVPRISRAQSMDALSSMATIAGYRAVLMAAAHAPRILPLMMTAGGTLQPAKVLVLGTGVAGLQACATAKRLGAVVSAYDIRPAARDQILSVGAIPVDLELETDESEDAGGYAKAQTEEQIAAQQAALAKVIAEQDIVITTAAVPGRKSPVLITEEMAKSLKPGSVVVDLAAERGGNCALTKADEVIQVNGVTIDGLLNLPARHPYHASQMLGNNMGTLLALLFDDDGVLQLDFNDEVVDGTVICHGGEVTHAMIRNILGLPEKSNATPEPEAEAAVEEGDK